MRSVSDNQREFDFADSLAVPAFDNSSTSLGASSANSTLQGAGESASAGTMSLPTFGEAINLYALAARRAARLNAATISETEREQWMTERQVLLDKQFDGTMTRAEEVRLEYVRWQLDRIEDARYGEGLDMLESIVLQYEQFQKDVHELQKESQRHNRGTRRR